jgi:hypothetical protein
MPQSVVSATPGATLPMIPIYAYAETRGHLVLDNRYPGGVSQRRPMVTTSGRSWQIRSRLTVAQFNTLGLFVAGLRYPA